jgi:hypothetical protein
MTRRDQGMQEMISPKYKQKKLGNQWTHGLCNCFDDCGECLTMCCLPVCYFPIAALRAGESPIVFCCGCAHTVRTKVREARKIEVKKKFSFLKSIKFYLFYFIV